MTGDPKNFSFCANGAKAKAVNGHPGGSELDGPPVKARSESQSEKKRGLSRFEILGVIIFALASLWFCGVPPTSPTEWVGWFFKLSWAGHTPMWMFSMFCVLVYLLLVLRYRKP
jgi:hypothetical protein